MLACLLPKESKIYVTVESRSSAKCESITDTIMMVCSAIFSQEFAALRDMSAESPLMKTKTFPRLAM
jgi:hypothetical protein